MELIENTTATDILDCAFTIHRELGPGLLESVYEKCLEYELNLKDCDVRTQVGIPMRYKQLRFETGFRIDLLVDKCVIVEVKAVEKLTPSHFAQLQTYLRMTNIRLGLLINFNEKLLKNVIHRIANNL